MNNLINIGVPKKFDASENYKKFTMEVQGVIDLIHFAVERPDNPATARAVLYAIDNHMHKVRNLYAPLVANFQLAIKELGDVKNGVAVQQITGSSAGSGDQKSATGRS